MNIELADIEKAAERISGVAIKTPVLTARVFSQVFDADILLKCENLQKTGAFKIRGAANAIGKMVENNDRSPVIASSAGNHAQGVAYAATKYGIKSTIVMPENAPLAKVEATCGYGAEVVQYGNCYDECYKKACDICAETGAKFLHPYDNADVIAGQGTIGLEILEQVPDVDVILVPAGGGGLLSGVAAAVKQKRPEVKVIGVQAEGADAVAQSFHAKKWICSEKAVTIADGIAVKNPGELTVDLICRYVDDVVTVSENNIYAAVVFLAERSKLIVEPAGAVSVAAILGKNVDVKGKHVVCVLSGGNIDISSIHQILQKGLVVRHRWAEFRIVHSPSSCSLHDVLSCITESGANLLSMRHDLLAVNLQPGEQVINAFCEVRNKAHIEELADTLQSRGCRVEVNVNTLPSLLNGVFGQY